MQSAPYFSILTFFGIYLAYRVIRLRRKHRIGIGSGGNKDLGLASRVFGNYVEYSVWGLVVLLAMEMVQASVWSLHLVGIMLCLGRFLHFLGVRNNTGYSAGRLYGMWMTFFALGFGAIFVVVYGSFAKSGI